MINWINPLENLPKSEEFVLITIKEGALTSTGETPADEVIPAFFVDDTQGTSVDGIWYPHFYEWGIDFIFDNRDVVAWMPFPEPYKKEDANA